MIKSIWTTSDGKLFAVTDVYLDSDGATWVNYTNTQTDQKYNCLRDAFVSRFTKQEV